MNCPQCQRPFQKCQLNIHIVKECPRRQVSCVNCAVSMAFEDKEACTNLDLLIPLLFFFNVQWRGLAVDEDVNPVLSLYYKL